MSNTFQKCQTLKLNTFILTGITICKKNLKINYIIITRTSNRKFSKVVLIEPKRPTNAITAPILINRLAPK